MFLSWISQFENMSFERTYGAPARYHTQFDLTAVNIRSIFQFWAEVCSFAGREPSWVKVHKTEKATDKKQIEDLENEAGAMAQDMQTFVLACVEQWEATLSPINWAHISHGCVMFFFFFFLCLLCRCNSSGLLCHNGFLHPITWFTLVCMGNVFVIPSEFLFLDVDFSVHPRRLDRSKV